MGCKHRAAGARAEAGGHKRRHALMKPSMRTGTRYSAPPKNTPVRPLYQSHPVLPARPGRPPDWAYSPRSPFDGVYLAHEARIRKAAPCL
jgi:hypothetical protein